MKVRLNMLLQNLALCLYKVPQESQLLRCLKGEWHMLDPSDPLLPTPNNNNTTSTLHKLATHVPANGPCINPFPPTPAAAPDWNSQVKVIPRNNEWNYHHVEIASDRDALGSEHQSNGSGRNDQAIRLT